MQSEAASRLFDTVPPDVCKLFNGATANTKKVVELLKYKKQDVADATNVSVESVRYDKMPAEVRERITEWAIAINQVANFFKGNVDKTLLWFQAPNRLLGDQSPRDMIRLGRFKKLQKFIHTALAENHPR